jgi:hypothetical protein
MSQRENFGLSWPRRSVFAWQPSGSSPKTINWTWRGSLDATGTISGFASNAGPASLQSLADGVPQDASAATSKSVIPVRFLNAFFSGDSGDLRSASAAPGVGHEQYTVPLVRRTDARSRGNNRPAGVAQRFHVILNKVDPSAAVR